MSRITQFVRNSGWIDLLRCGLIALFLGLLLVMDARDRMPPPMLLIVLMGIGLPYAFREVMYENLRISMWTMNGVALVMIALALLAKSAGFSPPKSTEREFVYVLAGAFPGIGPEAARWLVAERAISGIGLDTASLDHGPSKDFEAHRILNGAGLFGLENVANLDQIPEAGAVILALPMKIGGGSGGPTRIVALLPEGLEGD